MIFDFLAGTWRGLDPSKKIRIEILRGGYGWSIYHNLSPEIELYRILLISRDYFLDVLYFANIYIYIYIYIYYIKKENVYAGFRVM